MWKWNTESYNSTVFQSACTILISPFQCIYVFQLLNIHVNAGYWVILILDRIVVVKQYFIVALGFTSLMINVAGIPSCAKKKYIFVYRWINMYLDPLLIFN
jgi:hypothetical protein